MITPQYNFCYTKPARMKEGYPKIINVSREGRTSFYIRFRDSSAESRLMILQEYAESLSIHFDINLDELETVSSRIKTYLETGDCDLTPDEVGKRRTLRTSYEEILINLGLTPYHAFVFVSETVRDLAKTKKAVLEDYFEKLQLHPKNFLNV